VTQHLKRINYDFSFDDDTSRMFGCIVRSFDPSMSRVNDHQRSKNVNFYKIGIGGSNTVNKFKWKLNTLRSILQRFDETKATINYLKMDVESSEWPALEEMLATNVLDRVKQLAMEIHVDNTVRDLPKKLSILRQLEAVGFRRWSYAQNMITLRSMRKHTMNCCYEMVYVNAKYISRNGLSHISISYYYIWLSGILPIVITSPSSWRCGDRRLSLCDVLLSIAVSLFYCRKSIRPTPD
jgi:hypothetical protein